MSGVCPVTSFFFFNDTATTEIYTLSLHDALPIYHPWRNRTGRRIHPRSDDYRLSRRKDWRRRSEEHTSELQSRLHLVCRLLLEKKKKTTLTDAVAHGTQGTSTSSLYLNSLGGLRV